MYIVVVHSHIQEEHVERFREITVRNAEASRREVGCVRFDVIQQVDDLTRFTFIEMFKSEAASSGISPRSSISSPASSATTASAAAP